MSSFKLMYIYICIYIYIYLFVEVAQKNGYMDENIKTFHSTSSVNIGTVQ